MLVGKNQGKMVIALLCRYHPPCLWGDNRVQITPSGNSLAQIISYKNSLWVWTFLIFTRGSLPDGLGEPGNITVPQELKVFRDNPIFLKVFLKIPHSRPVGTKGLTGAPVITPPWGARGQPRPTCTLECICVKSPAKGCSLKQI